GRSGSPEDTRQAAVEELGAESWRTALAQEQLKPIADPHIHNPKWQEGAPVTFEFHVELRPEIALQRLGGFTVERTVTPVTAEQVEAQLAEVRGERAPWVPVEGERPRPKDLVNVTLAQREGAAIKDAQPYQLVLGEGRAIPEVEERIMSLLPGETVDARVRAALLEQVVQANRVEAPRPLVERALAAYAQAYGIPEDRWPQFAKEFQPIAEAQVRRDLVLDWIVERQGLHATAAEVQANIQ